jgi:C4-dicarboxylate-specific signal transduction histidine kinase
MCRFRDARRIFPRDEDNKLIGFAKVTRDITERREAEAALQYVQAAMIRLQKLEAIERLTGGVAHDFKSCCR